MCITHTIEFNSVIHCCYQLYEGVMGAIVFVCVLSSFVANVHVCEWLFASVRICWRRVPLRALHLHPSLDLRACCMYCCLGIFEIVLKRITPNTSFPFWCQSRLGQRVPKTTLLLCCHLWTCQGFQEGSKLRGCQV